jgi:ribose transport system substrate-binding protein
MLVTQATRSNLMPAGAHQAEGIDMRLRHAPRGVRRLLTGFVAVATATALAACGSTSDDGGGSGGGNADAGVDQAGLEEARTMVAEFSERPTEIPNDEPIEAEIPTGKRITFISCGTSTCNLEADIIREATEALGWDLTTIANNGTPEQTKAAWQQILRDRPDGVLYPATPRAAFNAELEQAAALGIEVAACCTTDPADEALDYVIGTPEQSERPGALIAAYMIDQSDGAGNVLYADISAFPILQSVFKGFSETMDEMCPACSYESLDIPVTSLGRDVPDRIVSYLRANPDTKYVALSVDGALGAGLPAALNAAGLTDITVMGEGPDETTLQAISNGQQEATVAFPYYEEMFSMVDALARKFAGVSPEAEVTVPDWIVTADTLPQDDAIFPVVEDVREQYFELWGV